MHAAGNGHCRRLVSSRLIGSGPGMARLVPLRVPSSQQHLVPGNLGIMGRPLWLRGFPKLLAVSFAPVWLGLAWSEAGSMEGHWGGAACVALRCDALRCDALRSAVCGRSIRS
jgi:hypothetical protein